MLDKGRFFCFDFIFSSIFDEVRYGFFGWGFFKGEICGRRRGIGV